MAFSIGNTASNNTSFHNGAGSSGTVTISLSAGSVLLIQVSTTALQSATYRTVSSVTSSNLTFAKRSQRQHHDTNIGAGTLFQNTEVWWAFSSGALTSEVVTVQLSATPDTGAINAVECKGMANPSSPWDPNISLPDTNDGDNTTATVTGLSTQGGQPIGFWISANSGGGNVLPNTPGTWTQAQIVIDLGTNSNASTLIYYQQFAAAQSNATWSAASSQRNWLVIGDAFNLVSPVAGLPPFQRKAG